MVPDVATFRWVQPWGYQSKSARSGAALTAHLFSPRSEERPMRASRDAQACIRSALRRRRRALGLTQQQAAQLLAMSRLTYHRIETGARHIHFADLAAICEMYDCHPAELLQDSQLAAACAHAAAALLDEVSA
jgi:DNA-binding Xre family transcriptional regulator